MLCMPTFQERRFDYFLIIVGILIIIIMISIITKIAHLSYDANDKLTIKIVRCDNRKCVTFISLFYFVISVIFIIEKTCKLGRSIKY